MQKPLVFYKTDSWDLYKEQKIVNLKPAVWQFKSDGIDLTNGGSYGLEFHDTGWKLIIHVSHDVKINKYKFLSKYDSMLCLQYVSEEVIQSCYNKEALDFMTEKIAKALDVPTNTNVVIKFHADCKPSEALKQWAQQFDKVIYPPPKSDLQTEYLKKVDTSNLQFKSTSFDFPVAYSGTKSNEFAELSKSLPGVNEIVKCPCTEKPDHQCGWSGQEKSIRSIVIHLNDYHKWKREDIADWLDQLPDEIDLNFKTPTEKESV